MIETVYIEKEVQDHPRVQKLLTERKFARVIPIEKYGEVFNVKAQDFRLQKKQPALIIAKKQGSFLHKIPASYGIGGEENFYFSHLLNCPFDCAYCFLQGMYRSANYVWFINYEDFQNAIAEELVKKPKRAFFFTGYDCDSLALESLTHFAEEFLPFFEKYPEAQFELRTKSIFLRPLLARKASTNCITAFTLSPESLAKEYERKAPPLHKRLQAITLLQEKGWQIGLRFDPLLYDPTFFSLYEEFFQEVFKKISTSSIHSATLGTFRLPKPFYDTMRIKEMEPKLLAPLGEKEGKASYPKELEEKMVSFCKENLLKYLPEEKIFCQ